MTVLGPEALVADELVLPYDPTVTDARRAAWRKAFIWALIGLGISLVIAGVMFLVFRWNDPLIFIFYGIFGALNVYRIVNAAIRWRLAVRTLKRIPWGTTAVQVDRDGVGLGQTFVAWERVTLLRARTPWWRKDSWLELSQGDPSTTGPRQGSRPWEVRAAVVATVVAPVFLLVAAVLFIVQDTATLRLIGALLGRISQLAGGAGWDTAGMLVSVLATSLAALAVAVALGVGATFGVLAWRMATGQGRGVASAVVALAMALPLVPLSPILVTGFLVVGVIGVVLSVLPASTAWFSVLDPAAAASLKLDQIPVVASTIDQAVRTLSGGQVRVDSQQLNR